MSLRDKARELAHTNNMSRTCRGLRNGVHSFDCDEETASHRKAMVAALEWASCMFPLDWETMKKQIEELKADR